jgi:hypothetical protein
VSLSKLTFTEIASLVAGLSEDERGKVWQAAHETSTLSHNDIKTKSAQVSAKLDLPLKQIPLQVPIDDIVQAVQHLNSAELEVLLSLLAARDNTGVSQITASFRGNVFTSMVGFSGSASSPEVMARRKQLLQDFDKLLAQIQEYKKQGDKQKMAEAIEQIKAMAKDINMPDYVLNSRIASL